MMLRRMAYHDILLHVYEFGQNFMFYQNVQVLLNLEENEGDSREEKDSRKVRIFSKWLIDRHTLNLNAFILFSFLKWIPRHEKTRFSIILSDLVNIVYNLNDKLLLMFICKNF